MTHQKGTCRATGEASHGQSRDRLVPLSPRKQKERLLEDLPAELAPCVLFSFVTCSPMCAYMVVATSVCNLLKINHFACQGSRGNRNSAHNKLITLKRNIISSKNLFSTSGKRTNSVCFSVGRRPVISHKNSPSSLKSHSEKYMLPKILSRLTNTMVCCKPLCQRQVIQ